MATQVKLSAGRRDGRGKGSARRLRAEGKLPAVLYGAGMSPIALTLSTHDTELLFRSISVDNTIVNIELDGERIPFPTLVRDVQTHPVRSELVHVDFLRIQTGVEVELEVPVHLSGNPKGVKDEGGVLEQVIHHIPVRCVPANIPEEFLVDVSAMEIGDSIHVEALAVPEGVEVLLDPEQTICSIQAPSRLTVEEEAGVPEEGVEPEMVGELEGDVDDEAEGED